MIIKLDQKKAIQNLTSTLSRWFKNGINVKDEGDFGIQRLNSGIVYPKALNFRLSKDVNCFAIGSCFARGIEKTMQAKGLNVLSISEKFKSFELKNEKVTGLGFTNKYTTFSILNQLEWSLGEKEFPYDSIVELEDGVAIDPHTNPSLKFVGKERTIERRKTLNEVFSTISDCKTIVITLGLTEGWYDKEANSFLNISPTQAMQKKYPGRYEFQVTDFQTNYDNLEAAYLLLKKHCPTDFNLVVTVSPVPLLATFSERDIIIANTYSKAILRTVAESLSFKYDNIHYFPSYEMVMNSDRDQVWEEDGRHVKGSFVNKIMTHFVDSHLE